MEGSAAEVGFPQEEVTEEAIAAGGGGSRRIEHASHAHRGAELPSAGRLLTHSMRLIVLSKLRSKKGKRRLGTPWPLGLQALYLTHFGLWHGKAAAKFEGLGTFANLDHYQNGKLY